MEEAFRVGVRGYVYCELFLLFLLAGSKQLRVSTLLAGDECFMFCPKIIACLG